MYPTMNSREVAKRAVQLISTGGSATWCRPRANRSYIQGFTLVELMIVVAIIGILSSTAIPYYQDYAIRAKLAKVVSYTDPIKLALAEYAQENGGSFPPAGGWTSVGLSAAPSLTTELQSIALNASGVIVETFANVSTGYNSSTVTLTPTLGATSVNWAAQCSYVDPKGNGYKVFGSGC